MDKCANSQVRHNVLHVSFPRLLVHSFLTPTYFYFLRSVGWRRSILSYDHSKQDGIHCKAFTKIFHRNVCRMLGWTSHSVVKRWESYACSQHSDLLIKCAYGGGCARLPSRQSQHAERWRKSSYRFPVRLPRFIYLSIASKEKSRKS